MQRRDPESSSGSEESDEFGDDNKKDQRKDAKKKTYKGDSEEGAEFDDILKQVFSKVPPGEGDEAGAVDPAKGAIKEPNMGGQKVKNNKNEPDEEYEIDWVYGYRSEEARNNAAFNSSGHAVYPTAALGIIFDYQNMTQIWYGGGKTDFGGRKQDDESKEIHTDDITACAVSFDRNTVATGQNGQKPLICIWDANTGEFECQKRMGKGCRLVTAIAFSASGKYIAASDAAEQICVHLFDRSGPVKAISTTKINMKVVNITWSPAADEFASVGSKHLAGYRVNNGKLDSPAKAPSKEMGKANMCSVSWLNEKKYAGQMVTGGSDGYVYYWADVKTLKNKVKNGKGSVHSVCCTNDPKAGGQVVLVGGNDKSLSCYNIDGKKLNPAWQLKVDSPPRSIDVFNGSILMGFKNGSLTVMPLEAKDQAQPELIMTSHCDGEVWGLQVVDISGKGDLRAITSADDGRILTYDIKKHKALAEGSIKVSAADDGGKKKKKKKKGKSKSRAKKPGASSMSSAPSSEQSRSIAYSSELQHLAVANNDGLVTVREVDWKKIQQGDPAGLNNCVKEITYATRWIEAMAYSPCHRYLAIGSHDQFIYVCKTDKDYKINKKKMAGHSGALTSLDWSIDSEWMRSTDGAHELLFWRPEQGKREPGGASKTQDENTVTWCDHTAKRGWRVDGITPKGCDMTHINAVCMDQGQKLIATGDDYGLVCVYRNPARPGNEYGKYRGHSEFVTNVKFIEGTKYLFSTGGQDQTCIQWKKC